MKWLYILLLSVLGAVPAAAAGDAALADVLTGMGFENVRALRSGNIVYAAVEDRTYRGTYRGLAVALQRLAVTCPDAEAYEVVLLDSDVPRVHVSAAVASGVWTVKADYDTRGVMGVLSETAGQGRSTGRIDITLHPKVSIDNHRLDVLCEWAVALAPAVETTLWRGNRITIQPVIPLCGGNLYDNNTLKYVRVGIADIEQEFLHGGRWSLKAAAGMLYPDLMGAHVEAGWQISSSLGVKVQAGLTGDAWCDGDGYHFTDIDRTTFLLKADYYNMWSRVQAQLTAGRFVYGDYGVRLDLTRHLGDYAIGLYGTLAEGEHNAGFHFAIPMGGRRQKRSGAVRVRLPEYFNWEYSMVSYFKFADESMGSEYKTRADENRSARYFNADYIRQNLQRCLDGAVR